jgi:hypothetical protein
VPIGIIALPKCSQVFFWRQMIRVQPVRRAKPISPRDARLRHHTFSSYPAHKQKSQDRPLYSDNPGFYCHSFD